MDYNEARRNEYQPTVAGRWECGPRLLDQCTQDLTALARAGGLDPVVGREEELSRVIQILIRRRKNNPALIGDPGVGKTAVAEGLAQALAAGDVPWELQGKRLLRLDLAALIAGTKYRGEFEDRVRRLLGEVKNAGNVILFLDELHTLVGAGSAEGAVDAANLLKPALGRGEVQVVGATTVEEYERYIEKDGALERRFQPVKVAEPTAAETVEILKGLRARYESHHHLLIPPETLEAAVSLGARYLPQRKFPDKAVDLMDEAAALARTKAPKAVPAAVFGKARRQRVTAAEVAQVVERWTGVPAGKVTAGEQTVLAGLEETLNREIVGQTEAVGALCAGVRRGRLGLNEPHRPAGCFLFLGPTGVGKTQLCKVLAQELFGSREALIRLDMSEFLESHQVSRLTGPPPGYVGYEEGGQLTGQVRRRPYSLVLLDEVEKAHPTVLNLLLQIMEEGRLTDGQGREADFRHTILVMTSNLGASALTPGRVSLGFGHGEEDAKAKVMPAVKEFFSPEFLGRLDEIVTFRALDREDLAQIAEKMLGETAKRLSRHGLTLEVSREAVDWLVEAALAEKLGARPLRRLIARQVADPAAQKLLTGEPFAGRLRLQLGCRGLELVPAGLKV